MQNIIGFEYAQGYVIYGNNILSVSFGDCVRERVCVCVCVRERERLSVYVREKETKCVRERER